MRSVRLQLLSLLLAAAVIVLGAVTITHVHGVSDPGAHHTPADFMLQFQTLGGVLLSGMLLLLRSRASQLGQAVLGPLSARARETSPLVPRAPPAA